MTTLTNFYEISFTSEFDQFIEIQIVNYHKALGIIDLLHDGGYPDAQLYHCVLRKRATDVEVLEKTPITLIK